jgi:hypothetical protein
LFYSRQNGTIWYYCELPLGWVCQCGVRESEAIYQLLHVSRYSKEYGSILTTQKKDKAHFGYTGNQQFSSVRCKSSY